MTQRVKEVEIKLMYLEHTLQKLDGVVLEGARREAELVTRVERLERQMVRLLQHLDDDG